MTRTWKLVMAVLLAAAAFWAYRALFPSDAAAIRRLLHEAAQTASVDPGQSRLGIMTDVQWLLGKCTEDIRIVISARGIKRRALQGKDQLKVALLAVKSSSQGLSVELIDLVVEVSEDRTQASAQFIARATAAEFTDEIFQEFKVQLQRIDGDWKLQLIEPLQALGL